MTLEDRRNSVGILLLTACAINDIADNCLIEAAAALRDTPYMRKGSHCHGCIQRAKDASRKSQAAMRWWMGGMGAWNEVVAYCEARANQCDHDLQILRYSIADYLLKAHEPYSYERAAAAVARIMLETATIWQGDVLERCKRFCLSRHERIYFAQASKAGALKWLDEATELWDAADKSQDGISVIDADPRCKLAYEVLFRRLTNPDDNAEAIREASIND